MEMTRLGEGAWVAFASQAPGTFFSFFFLDYSNVYLEKMACMYGHHCHDTQPRRQWGTVLEVQMGPFYVFTLDVVLTYRYSCHHLHHHISGNASHTPQYGFFQHPMQTTYMDYKHTERAQITVKCCLGRYCHQLSTQWQQKGPEMCCVSCPPGMFYCY